MNPIEILKSARNLISNPDKWTQNAYARSAGGGLCYPESASACQFCSVGAIRKAVGDYRHKNSLLYDLSLRILGSVLPGCADVYSFNDNASHAEVIAAFDRAIEIAKK